MKGTTFYIAIFMLALIIIPMVALRFGERGALPVQTPVHNPSVQSAPAEETKPSVEEALIPFDEEEASGAYGDEAAGQDMPVNTSVSRYGVTEFKILDETTGKVETVPLRDFVRGAVAAEMPGAFHEEALKAQAVAAHTFALHNHLLQQQNPDPALQGADFSADPSNMLVYITEEKAREFYGEEKADLHWGKICAAADSVVNYVLEYDDEPIVAAYHAISAGQTEDASNVWSGEAPYLLPAESEGDLLAPNYETVVTLPRETVKSALLMAYPDAQLPDSEPETWFSAVERSGSGYVTSVGIGGVEAHGKDIRTLFALRSHNFEVLYQEDAGVFLFVVYGYGHGVGLSQYGADFLARQGYTFDEILMNYYSGVTLRQIAVAA